MDNNYWIIGVSGEPVPLNNTGGENSTNTNTVTDPNAVNTKGKDKPDYSQLIFLVAIFVIMYMLLFRGPKKKQQQHKQMVQKLQKNDKVQTIGGIIGTVVDIRDNEIVLKIDESNNTKMRVSPNAIGRTISNEKD